MFSIDEYSIAVIFLGVALALVSGSIYLLFTSRSRKGDKPMQYFRDGEDCEFTLHKNIQLKGSKTSLPAGTYRGTIYSYRLAARRIKVRYTCITKPETILTLHYGDVERIS